MTSLESSLTRCKKMRVVKAKMPQASNEELRVFADNERRLCDIIEVLTNKLFEKIDEVEKLKAK